MDNLTQFSLSFVKVLVIRWKMVVSYSFILVLILLNSENVVPDSWVPKRLKCVKYQLLYIFSDPRRCDILSCCNYIAAVWPWWEVRPSVRPWLYPVFFLTCVNNSLLDFRLQIALYFVSWIFLYWDICINNKKNPKRLHFPLRTAKHVNSYLAGISILNGFL